MILIGVGLGIYTLWKKNVSGFLNVPLIFMIGEALLLGLLLVLSSIMLYAIKKKRSD